MIPTLEAAKAMASLDGNRDFGVVLEWLRSEYRESVSTLLVSTNPVLVHQAQGYSLCLEDFIKSATTSIKPRLISEVANA